MTSHEKPTFTIKKLECGRPVFRVDKIGKRHFSKYLSGTCWVLREFVKRRDFRNDFSTGTKNPLPLRNDFWHWGLAQVSINYAHATSLSLVPSCLLHPPEMSTGHVGKSPSLGVWWHEETDSTEYSQPAGRAEKWLKALSQDSSGCTVWHEVPHRTSCWKQRAASSIVAPLPSSRPKLYPLLTEGAHRKLPQPVLAGWLTIQSGLTWWTLDPWFPVGD